MAWTGTTCCWIFLQSILLCSALDITVTRSVNPSASEMQFSNDETKAIDFLRRYGYLPSRIPLTRALFTNALNNYQVMANLPISDRLNERALSSMGTLRCGNPDVRRSERTGLARYEILAPRWRKENLTYRVSRYPIGSPRLTRSVVDSALATAVRMWSNVSRVDFIQIDDKARASADIDIRFERSSYDTACAIYFQMGELAHATMTRNPAKVHFNGRVTWKVGLVGDTSEVDLIAVAAHEMGHVLGLDHSSDRRALMYASYRRGSSALGRDDVQAIQMLYGIRKPSEPSGVEPRPPAPEETPEEEPAERVGCPKTVTRKMPDGKRPLCAVVYTDRLCGGNRLPIESGNKTRQLNGAWDDEIASAEVNPSCTLKVCHRRAFTGGCIDLDGGREGHNFNRLPLGYNGMVSSMACVCDEENVVVSPITPPSDDDEDDDPPPPSTLQKGKEPPPYIPNTGNRAKTCAVLVQSWEPGATRAWVEEETAIRMPANLVGVAYEYMATRRGCSLYYCTRPAFGGICEMLGPSRHLTAEEELFEVASLSCGCE